LDATKAEDGAGEVLQDMVRGRARDGNTPTGRVNADAENAEVGREEVKELKVERKRKAKDYAEFAEKRGKADPSAECRKRRGTPVPSTTLRAGGMTSHYTLPRWGRAVLGPHKSKPKSTVRSDCATRETRGKAAGLKA